MDFNSDETISLEFVQIDKLLESRVYNSFHIFVGISEHTTTDATPTVGCNLIRSSVHSFVRSFVRSFSSLYHEVVPEDKHFTQI